MLRELVSTETNSRVLALEVLQDEVIPSCKFDLNLADGYVSPQCETCGKKGADNEAWIVTFELSEVPAAWKRYGDRKFSMVVCKTLKCLHNRLHSWFDADPEEDEEELEEEEE